MANSLTRKYKFSDTILIEPVIIKTKKEIKDDGHFRIYVESDYSLKVTDRYSGYSDVIQLLQGRVAGVQIFGNFPEYVIIIRGSTSLTGQSNPLFLLDGMPADLNTIISIPVSTIDKVEVLKDPSKLAVFGSRSSQGVISILTKNGFEEELSPVVYSSNNKKVYGFYQARTFYSPKYDTPPAEPEKPDLRTTIHWDPNIITDAIGNATITFYNADKPAVIQAKIEGITESGIPVTGSAKYEVEPQTLRP